MINCQKFNFLLILTINLPWRNDHNLIVSVSRERKKSVTTGVRELDGTSQMSLVTHNCKGRNARDLDEISSGLARMKQLYLN